MREKGTVKPSGAGLRDVLTPRLDEAVPANRLPDPRENRLGPARQACDPSAGTRPHSDDNTRDPALFSSTSLATSHQRSRQVTALIQRFLAGSAPTQKKERQKEKERMDEVPSKKKKKKDSES